MDKEMEFKNKSIKEKVNGSFEMIIVLYVVSVAFAVFLNVCSKNCSVCNRVFCACRRYCCACDYNSLQYSGNIETG